MGLELIENTGEFISEHEVVLQVLDDLDIPGVEAGLATIPGKHIPFSTTHPVGGFKDKDPETVFNQDIKSAGTMGDAWIDMLGRPKLKANIKITDPDVETLIKQGKVFISDAYWRDPKSIHISSFDFDHLLIYPRESLIPQGEPVALIVNQNPKTEIIMSTESSTTEPTSLEYANALLHTNQEALVEKEKLILTLNQEIELKEKLITEQSELIQNQTAAITELNEKLQSIENEKELKLNQDIFSKYPAGIQKKFEGRFAELGDPSTARQLILEMNQDWAAIPAVPETKIEGQSFVANQAGDERAAIEAAKRILSSTYHRVDKSGSGI